MLVKVGNEVFPGLRSDEIHARTLGCRVGRRPSHACAGIYMLRAGGPPTTRRAMRQAAEGEIAAATPNALRSGMAFVRVRETYMLRAGRDLLFLPDLLRDPLVLRTQFRIALEVLGQRAMQLLILPAVRRYVAEDAQLLDIGVVFRIDSFEFWM